MLHLLFWLLALPTALLGLLLLVMTLAGRQLSAATPSWLALLSALGLLLSVAWAGRLAVTAARPGVACLLLLLAWGIFIVTMIVNGLLHQQNWQ